MVHGAAHFLACDDGMGALADGPLQLLVFVGAVMDVRRVASDGELVNGEGKAPRGAGEVDCDFEGGS